MAELFIEAKPKLNRVKDMKAKDCVRAYRGSPEEMLLQFRLDNSYVSVYLSFDDAKKLGEYLIAKGQI